MERVYDSDRWQERPRQPRPGGLGCPVGAKFGVYCQRRGGEGVPVTPALVAEFLQFIVARWQVPEWQRAQAEMSLKRHFGFPSGAAAPESEGLTACPAPAPEAGPAAGNLERTAAARLMLKEALRRVEGAIRSRHHSLRTEARYQHWLRQYWAYLQRRKAEPGFAERAPAAKVKALLEYLAVERHVAAATQNQALNARVCFYKQVLGKPFGELGEVLRASRPKRLPEVLTREQTQRLLDAMQGTPQWIARLRCGTGMRLAEGLSVRVKDVDFDRNVIFARQGKGAKDRVTLLPESLRVPRQGHLERVKRRQEADLASGQGEVLLPDSLERKYPAAAKEWGWQWVLPAEGFSRAPRSGRVRRHHVLEDVVQRAVKAARQKAGLAQRVGCHTLRHCFATHLLDAK